MVATGRRGARALHLAVQLSRCIRFRAAAGGLLRATRWRELAARAVVGAGGFREFFRGARAWFAARTTGRRRSGPVCAAVVVDRDGTRHRRRSGLPLPRTT